MADPRSLNRIQRQLLTTFFHFLRRVLEPTIFRKLLTTLLERLDLSLRFFRIRWHIMCKNQWKEWNYLSLGPTDSQPKIDGEYGSTINADGQSDIDGTSVFQSTIDDQIVISPDNIALSLYPSGNEEHDGLTFRSSQTPDTPISSHSPGILFQGQNTSNLPHIPDKRRPEKSHHRMRGYPQAYCSDSTEPTEQVASASSSIRDSIMVTVPSHPIVSPSELSPQETLISSPTCVGGLGSPALRSRYIRPVAPENFKRYEKRRKIPKVATTVTLSPFLIDFSDHDDIPGWTTHTHPEGGRYFHNAKKRLFTDVDIHDSAFLKRITMVYNTINLFIVENHIQIPENTDLVLDVDLDEKKGKYINHYYFADHKRRIVFFLDKFSSNDIPHWAEIDGVSSGTHLRQALETQYWWHCHSYPNCIELSNDRICELRSLIIHFVADCMTSPYANSPYTLEDLEKILVYTNSLKENIGKPYSGCTSYLSRLMHSFSKLKYLNFHGQPEARLNRDQSVYGDRTNRRSWFIRSISVFLFSAPDFHLRTLQKMWVDGIMHQAVWEQSFKKMTDEWREFILYATVLLNANVAFLAIQSVDSNHNPYRSPAQISSYCSISSSVGSIILGLLLVRQNQTKHRETILDVQKFLKKRAHSWLGLETLAIMFSLPYALLMWGMVSFLIAFWFMCLQNSSPATRTVIVTICCVILGLIIWCIGTSWEKQPPSDAQTPDEFLSFEAVGPVREQKWKGFKFERDIAPPPPPAEDSLLSALDPILSWRSRRRSDSSKTIIDEESVGKERKSSS